MVRLLIGPGLQAVFDPAQEVIRLLEIVDRFRRQASGRAQGLQHPQNAAFAQRRFAPAVNQLERLADELDLTNPARP